MASQAVHGLEELIDRLDHAVRQNTPERVTGRVKDTLERMIAARTLDLPPAMVEPLPDRYARRLLYKSAAHGYSVLVMTWGPAQVTPLHDHAGMWCVEGVLVGDIAVTQYELVEQSGERYRFRRQGTVNARPGDAGALIPPFEYHTITNATPGDKAVTVHVYAGEMTHCTIFEPAADGWHDRRERELSYCE
jgi:predicted metal-dependent enzyme (double-stranded beta helix superfamily)